MGSSNGYRTVAGVREPSIAIFGTEYVQYHVRGGVYVTAPSVLWALFSGGGVNLVGPCASDNLWCISATNISKTVTPLHKEQANQYRNELWF